MFKLHRHRSDRLAERFEFRFSNFRAIQVPKVSDKLFLSIVSVETGKTVSKSSKATARNGTCQWPDSISESIWISQDDGSKEFEECQYKIVVSMGSMKAGILGEVFLNLTNYLSSVDSSAISLPLKRCNSGTILQFKIQCLATKSKLRGVKYWNETSSRPDELSPHNDDMDSKSDGSDNMFNRSIGSSSGNHLGGGYPDEPGNRDTSFSASGSHRSSNSGDSSLDRTNFSPRNNLNGGLYMGRQDSGNSYVSNNSAGRGDDLCRSNNSSFTSRASGPTMLQGHTTQAFANGLAQLSLGTSDSSKDLLEAAEETIEELRDEAKMWERHSRKLKVDLEMLKKECSEKSKKQAHLERELSAAHTERDSLKQEIEELKSSLEELTSRQTNAVTPRCEDMTNLQKELEDEMKFLKEANADLMLQLKKTQEANIELVSILQELEETIEVQRLEMSKLSQVSDVNEHEESKNKFSGQEESEWARKLSLKEEEIMMLKEQLSRILNNENANGAVSDTIHLELEKENELLRAKIQELEKDCAELTDENLELLYKMKEVNRSTKEGEGFLASNSYESEIDMLTSQKRQLEQLIKNKELLDAGGHTEASASKIRNLETKCADLELKLLSFKSEATDLEKKFKQTQEELEDRNLELSELKHKLESSHNTEFGSTEAAGSKGYQTKAKEWEGNEPEVDVLKASILLKEQEIDSLRHSKLELESFISDIQKDKSRLEESFAASLKESSITSKCLDDVQQDLVMLTSSIDSHVSANKILERKVTELESCKTELELHIAELEQENIQLSERISGLEAQLTYLTNDKESNKLELDDSRSLILDLKDKVERKQAEMETQKLDLKQKQQEAQKRLLEAQEDMEVLRRSNSKFQATVESLIEECSSLQTSNADLRRKKLELHGRVTHLEMELGESQKRSLDFCKRVEFLEVKLSSLQKDISSKEQYLLSELESIFQEHKEHEERINCAHLMLNKIEKEKTVEVENLEREIMNLTAQVSSTHDEREKATLDAIHEVLALRADKAKLEASLQDVNAQMKHYETQVEGLRRESKNKIKGLVDSLNASKQSEEMLMADIQHMQTLMEAAKSNEEKFRKTSSELELKLKSSDYEKQLIVEEISGLKVQVQKIAYLQDEVLKLKSSLDETKFEKGKLQELLQSTSGECEELKAEKVMLADKVSSMQEALNNGEEEKRSKIALQAKLVRLESDLSAKEASYVHETELKNELSRIRRANSEYQRKIQSLEQERNELTRRTQFMEKELELKMPQNNEETVIAEGDEEVANDSGGITVNAEADLQSKLQLLETKLSEALKENSLYRAQLQSSISEVQLGSEIDMTENKDERISSLETELKDMKERLLNMSMQYAEVEAQREQLVMQLKSVKKGRWFS